MQNFYSLDWLTTTSLIVAFACLLLMPLINIRINRTLPVGLQPQHRRTWQDTYMQSYVLSMAAIFIALMVTSASGSDLRTGLEITAFSLCLTHGGAAYWKCCNNRSQIHNAVKVLVSDRDLIIMSRIRFFNLKAMSYSKLSLSCGAIGIAYEMWWVNSFHPDYVTAFSLLLIAFPICAHAWAQAAEKTVARYNDNL